MSTLRGFFWPEDASLKRRRLLLSMALLIATTLWFVLGGLLAVATSDSTRQFLWGSFWIVGSIIFLVFIRLLKTRHCQSA